MKPTRILIPASAALALAWQALAQTEQAAPAAAPTAEATSAAAPTAAPANAPEKTAALSSTLPAYQPMPEMDEQLRIMSRVIEDSLDQNSGPRGWRRPPIGRSAFDTSVSGTYVPGVGAIFTIPVNIPLIDRGGGRDETAPTAPAADDVDLWDRAERRTGAPPNFFMEQPRFVPAPLAPTAPEAAVPAAPRSVAIPAPAPERTLESATAEAVAAEIAIAQFQSADTPGTVRIERREAVSPQIRVFDEIYTPFQPTRRYEEADVRKLRSTLLATVAKYGHRMEGLPKDEKLILLLENRGPDSSAIGQVFEGQGPGANPQLQRELNQVRNRVRELQEQLQGLGADQAESRMQLQEQLQGAQMRLQNLRGQMPNNGGQRGARRGQNGRGGPQPGGLNFNGGGDGAGNPNRAGGRAGRGPDGRGGQRRGRGGEGRGGGPEGRGPGGQAPGGQGPGGQGPGPQGPRTEERSEAIGGTGRGAAGFVEIGPGDQVGFRPIQSVADDFVMFEAQTRNPGVRETYSISINATDLSASATAESLSDKVKERLY